MAKVPKSDILKKRLLEALEKSLGVVTSACKIAGCSRKTFYLYRSEDEEFAAAVQDISEIAIDFAETHLHSLIRNGDTSSTIFYLKTKGKKRGYVERQEHDHTTGGDKFTDFTFLPSLDGDSTNEETTDSV